MYAAASGLDANLVNQDAITENLAHANSPGYRRQGTVFEPFEPILARATAATPGVAVVAQGPRNTPPPPVPGGGGSNFTKIANLQNAQTLSNGTQTVGGYFASLVGQMGVRVQDLSNQQTAQTTLGQQITAQQQSVSGVDTNEELTNLLSYQRSFQMASEYINVVNNTLTTLMGIIPITSNG